MRRKLRKRIKWMQLLWGFCVVFWGLGLSTPAQAQVQAAAPSTEMPSAWEEVVEQAPVTAEDFKQLSPGEMVQGALSLLGENLTAPLRLLARLCGVLIVAAVAKSVFGGSSSQTAELLDTVVTLSIFTVCSPVILGLIGSVQSAITDSRTYLACFVPVFAAVMISCGQVGSSAVYSGFFFAFVSLMANVLSGVALPLTRIFLALHAAGAVGSVVDLTRVTSGITKWMKWLLALCATIFTMVLGLQGVLAQNADSFALKTGKFLVGSSIPVVGRAVSDAMGSVFAGLKLMKGTVGFAAVAVLAAAFLPVIIQCFVYHVVFSAGAMVAAATDSPKTARMFDGFASCASLFVSMAFFFCLVVICATMLMILLGSGG